MKAVESCNNSKLNFIGNDERIRKWWDSNVSRAEIARRLNVEKSNIERKTKGWERPSYRKLGRNSKFDYYVAYCLLEEHGLTFEEAAFALEVSSSSIKRAMQLYHSDIEAAYEEWKSEYTKKGNNNGKG